VRSPHVFVDVGSKSETQLCYRGKYKKANSWTAIQVIQLQQAIQLQRVTAGLAVKNSQAVPYVCPASGGSDKSSAKLDSRGCTRGPDVTVVAAKEDPTKSCTKAPTPGCQPQCSLYMAAT
jgi:hypothetical protein